MQLFSIGDIMKCIICNNDTQEFENNLYRFHYCINCNYIFKDSAYYLDELSEKNRYEQHSCEVDENYEKQFIDLIEKYIFPRVEQDFVGIDYGCGQSKVLINVFKKYYGIDIDGYDKYFYDIKLKKVYDLIVCTEVIEHVKNPLEFVSDLLSYLKVGGLLVIKTNFHDNDLETFKKWWYTRDSTHIGFFNNKTFEFIANKFNLEIIDSNEASIITFRK